MERPGNEMEHELLEFQERRRRRQERRKRRLVAAVVVTLLALLLAGLTAFLTYERGMRQLGLSSLRNVNPSHNTASRLGAAAEAGRVTVLVIGTDDEIDRVGRTDTIMLVSFDPRSGDAGVLSIPRDTRVEIPGRPGYHRINVAHALGGPGLVMLTVEQLLGVPVHHYVAVNFTGFERFIDALGGVEVYIPQRMKYDDYAQGLHIDLQPGRQLLNGREALHYVRFRADGLGDVALVDPVREIYDGRVRRQLEFAQIVARKVLSVSTLPRLPQLVQELFGMVRTDISIDRAVALAVAARQVDPSRIETAVLPGTSDVIGGASYWVHDPVRTQLVVDRVIRGVDLMTLEVLNGNGQTGAAADAADWLRRNGYDVVRIGNAPGGFSYERTQVIVNEYGVDADALTALVATRLAGGALGGAAGAAGPVVVYAPPTQSHPSLARVADAGNGRRGTASAAPTGDTGAAGMEAAAAQPDVTIIVGSDFQG